MKILINPPKEQWNKILERPVVSGQATEEKVMEMLTRLKEFGWDEVSRMTAEFDGFIPEPALVTEDELKEAGSVLPETLKAAIEVAAGNIRRFHESQLHQLNPVIISRGITCYQKWVPVERVGLYIPGGTAPLFSTVLMLALPALIAGCRELVLCTPGNSEGKINPAILYAAHWCGIRKVFRIGGVQAIAAMAYGLGPVPKVDKLFGPGNAWVTRAKQLVSRDGVAIDMPAGPSELLVVADESASPAFIAADLLSQAEHGTDSQVLFLTTSWELAEQVHHAVDLQLTRLPRKDIASKVVENSKIIVCPDEASLMEMVNQYAPEHLILATKNHTALAGMVQNAGSVFLGHYSPESAGDYASGTNHTLPTSGFAKAYSGLSVDSFMKTITFQELTRDGLRSIEQTISLMARAEGLEGHARAAEIRREDFKTIRKEDGKTAETDQDNVSNQDGETDHDPSLPAAEGSRTGSMHHLLEYLNPLNLLTPLNILDPENNMNPLNLLNRFVPENPDAKPVKLAPLDLVRPNIASLVPYSSARDEFSGHQGIFLDANENPNDTGLNRYPDPCQRELRCAVAALKNIEPENIFMGNGSDEAIDLLIRIFCEPRQSRLITMNPTYGMYSVCAGVQDVGVDKVLLNPDFTVNIQAVLDTVRFDTRMIFLCSPNNPTGTQIPLKDIRFLARKFYGIIVVDEAYIDFAEGPSALSLISEYPNLVILQTFSKAWGLAGVRVGMAFADAAIIRIMNKVKYPYNINVLSSTTVRDVVKEVGPDVRLIISERRRVALSLKSVACVEKVYPSEANFLLVKFSDPKSTYRYLADHGIIVRDRSNQPLLEGCLRITVGTPRENDDLLEALKNMRN